MNSNVDDKWDKRFLLLADHIAQWSRDPSTKVGSVITLGNRVISVGYNGFPRNCKDDTALYINREIKYKRVIHAEKNAMMFAKRDLEKHILYVTLPPCSQCAAMIIQTGISRVVTIHPTKEEMKRWGDDINSSMEMFREADVDIKFYEPEYIFNGSLRQSF